MFDKNKIKALKLKTKLHIINSIFITLFTSKLLSSLLKNGEIIVDKRIKIIPKKGAEARRNIPILKKIKPNLYILFFL